MKQADGLAKRQHLCKATNFSGGAKSSPSQHTNCCSYYLKESNCRWQNYGAFMSNEDDKTKENVMTNTLAKSIVKFVAAVALAATASFANAGNQPDINWSVTVGSSHPATAIYTPPPVVYVQPRPVYVQPVTVVPYDHVREIRHGKGKHRHGRHHHHRHHH
jgi:hypothetical protein